MKIPLLMFMSEIKIDLKLKKSNSLYICIEVALMMLERCVLAELLNETDFVALNH